MAENEIINEISLLPISNRTKNCLMRGNVFTINELVYRLNDESLLTIYQFGRKALSEVSDLLKNNEKYKILIKNSETFFQRPIVLKENSEERSLSSLLLKIFNRIQKNYFEVFFDRTKNNLTLQEISEKNHVTRERIRQIENKTRISLSHSCLVNFEEFSYYLQLGRNFRDEISINKWKEKIEKEDKSTEKYSISNFYTLKDRVEDFHVFICLIKFLSKKINKNLRIPDNVRKAVNINNWSLTIFEFDFIDSISKVQLRLIRKIITFTGGIHITELKKIFNIYKNSQIFSIMNEIGWKNFDNDWFTFKSKEQIKPNNPIISASLKTLSICNPISINCLYDGIRRHISRFFPALAPPQIIKYILNLFSIIIDDDIAEYQGAIYVKYSEGENAFLKAIIRYGNLISLYEIAQYNLENGLSIALACRISKISPIVEKIFLEGHTFYKKRGISFSYEDQQKALSRIPEIDRSVEINYSTDGLIIYQISISPYFLLIGGLLINRLPNLGENWKIIVNNKQQGFTDIEPPYLLGLKRIFDIMMLEQGERIKLVFKVKERELLIMRAENE